MGDTDKVKILVVDDVEVNRFTLRDIIKDMGYMPVLTENGEQALKVVEIFPIQLIITDIAMPEMDGYELCKRIKQNPNTRDIPLIFISAFDSPEDVVKGFEVQGEDYSTKPFIPEVVRARIKVHLSVFETKRKLQEMNQKLQTSVSEQMHQMDSEKKNVLYALLRVVKEGVQYDAEAIERKEANCRTLAEALQLTNEYGDVISDRDLDTIGLASDLCDLGYVAVSAEILSHFGSMTDAEFEIMKNHTTIGANILLDIKKNSKYNDFVTMAAEIAKYHHENWDGSGYPNRVSGEQIPISAQIVHIINDYDALYHNPDRFKDAMEIMEKDVGKRYNPVVFQVFQKIVRQLKK